MTSIRALAAAGLVALLCVSCTPAKPVEIPKPEGIDLGAAAGVGDSGNGLWLLDGPVAAAHVVDAMRVAGNGTMTAQVQELIAVEQGDPLPGRTIQVTSRTDGAGVRVSIAVGDQAGELVILGDEMWVQGNEAFAARLGVQTDTEDFVCVSRRSTSVADLERLTNPADFLRTTLLGLEIGALPPESTGADYQTLVLGTGGAPTGQLLIDAVGPPLPQNLIVGDQSGTVQAAFTWGDVDEIRAPEQGGCEARR